MTSVDELMEKVQEYASAWALVDSRFDHGDMLEEATLVKEELRLMLNAAVPQDNSAYKQALDRIIRD